MNRYQYREQVVESKTKPGWVGDRVWLSVNKLGLNAFAWNSRKRMLASTSLSSGCACKRCCICVCAPPSPLPDCIRACHATIIPSYVATKLFTFECSCISFRLLVFLWLLLLSLCQLSSHNYIYIYLLSLSGNF